MKRILPAVCCVFAVLAAATVASAQHNMVRVLVGSPFIGDQTYRPVANVMANSIIAELNRTGGMEMVPRELAERYLTENGLPPWIDTRDLAREVGEQLDADIVIYSTLDKRYDYFLYSIAFLEVERDIVQRIINGNFSKTEPPSGVGRVMREEVAKLTRYIPSPTEMRDPGSVIRETRVDPENLPQSSSIEDIPRIDRFGYIEQIFSYFDVMPGELEYRKLASQRMITRFTRQQETDYDDLYSYLDQFYVYGDFAIRHGMQAYLVKDCSMSAINVLLANKIPVFVSEHIFTGYTGLTAGGFCMFRDIDGNIIDSFDLTHRKRMAVFFMVPKPGQKGGVSREFLESAVGYFNDEWGQKPQLVEIGDSMFDIISSGAR